jgi:hypothetical protein
MRGTACRGGDEASPGASVDGLGSRTLRRKLRILGRIILVGVGVQSLDAVLLAFNIWWSSSGTKLTDLASRCQELSHGHIPAKFANSTRLLFGDTESAPLEPKR